MKKNIIYSVIALFSLGLLVGLTPTEALAKTKFVTIGTGGITGVYYPTGGAIGKIVNKKENNMVCV